MKIVSLCIVGIAIVIGIGYLAMVVASKKEFPMEIGISFSHVHAESLGLDWKEVYTAMLSELQPSYIRIAAMWNEVELEQGTFNFEQIDFMMDAAKEAGTRVVLVVGQKAPRWPECHIPTWVEHATEEEFEKHVLTYIKTVVEKYKDHDALELWQVENEPDIRFAFGECEKYNSAIVKKEIELVKQVDPQHRTMITDSGELSTWRRSHSAGDVFGTTLYRIVRTPKGKIVTYDWLPPAFYRWKAKLWGVDTQNFFIAELQAEPWFVDSTPRDTAIEEQEKTMNPERLLSHIAYAKKTGAARAYLWGVEWWYYMKAIQQDNRYWNEVKQVLEQ